MAGLWYRVGTVSVTNGSKKVTGFGTKWETSVAKPDKGHPVHAPDGRIYELDYVESDTVLWLVSSYAGPSAADQAYAIDIARSGTNSAFSRDLSAFVAYHQGQMDGWQQLLTGTGNVTLTAPDGAKLTVPSIHALGKPVPDHEAKAGAHPISGVEGLQAALDKRVLTSGGAISNLRRAGQESGSLVSNVAAPLPNNNETVVYNSFAIKLLSGWTSTMVRFRVVIRDYFNRHRNVDITFSGYAYSDTQNWVAEASGASAVGTGALDWQVYTHKSSDGTPVIYIYNPNGYDDYSTVEIVDDVSRGVPPVYAIARVAGYAGTPVNVSRHYHSGNVVGPLSGGAIIERGANANGEYVKWADGTMMCTLSPFTIPATALGASFRAARVLPATFSSTGVIMPVASVLSTNSGNIESAGSLYRNGLILSASASQMDFNGYTYVSQISTPLTIGAQVFGRWK
ncbi:MAG: hypothetical protein KA754_06490 [Corallincola sp.]|nr:hypothetical protein [Corallincola sp.]